MYKDKTKQREAGAERQRRYRENRKALHPAIVAGIERLTTFPDGSVDEQARAIRMTAAINYQRLYPDKQYTGIGIAPEDMPDNPIAIGVTKPGDADYVPLCGFTREWMDRRKIKNGY